MLKSTSEPIRFLTKIWYSFPVSHTYYSTQTACNTPIDLVSVCIHGKCRQARVSQHCLLYMKPPHSVLSVAPSLLSYSRLCVTKQLQAPSAVTSQIFDRLTNRELNLCCEMLVNKRLTLRLLMSYIYIYIYIWSAYF